MALRSIYFVGCLLCFGIFFFLGRQEPAPSLTRVEKPAAMPTVEPSLSKASSITAFSLPNLSGTANDPSLAKRFATPYPKATPEFGLREREITSRLSILKALGRQNANEPGLLPLPLYRSILANPQETWVVKRQALRNALALSAHLPEQERDRFIASVPPALLLQAGKTEQELLQDYLNHARR